MKIRQGFVSNSSTSSFIVALEKGKKLKDLTPEIFGVTKDSLFYPLAEKMVEVLRDSEKQKVGGDHWDWDRVKELIEAGYDVYVGSASNEADDGAEQAMVDMNIDYNKNGIIVEKEAGY